MIFFVVPFDDSTKQPQPQEAQPKMPETLGVVDRLTGWWWPSALFARRTLDSKEPRTRGAAPCSRLSLLALAPPCIIWKAERAARL
jgi:hypothetical protein